jgi:hypothetical protein
LSSIPSPSQTSQLRVERLVRVVSTLLTAEPAAFVDFDKLGASLIQRVHFVEAFTTERIIETLTDSECRCVIDLFKAEGWVVTFEEGVTGRRWRPTLTSGSQGGDPILNPNFTSRPCRAWVARKAREPLTSSQS